MKEKLLVISNDKIFYRTKYYTSNNDLNTILKSFVGDIHTYLIARKCNKKLNFSIDAISKKNKIFFLSLCELKKLSKNFKDDCKILMLSITPFNFLIFFYLKYILKIRVRGHLYLRSDGFKEYEVKYFKFGYSIYYLLFKILTNSLSIISCSSNFTNVKNFIRVYPTEIDFNWINKRKKPQLKIPMLLFIGRYKVEKGIFSLLGLLKQIKIDYNFLFVGYHKDLKVDKKIHFKKKTNSTNVLRSYYDQSNIFILPSYTEGYPKVILESLARLRPVIVFDDIKHVKKGLFGVFSCKRDANSLVNKVQYIIENYYAIQKKMIQNKLHTKKKFQNRLKGICL